MTKSAIIDSVLKEAGFMDFVRNIASKFNLKIPTKKEALDYLKQYLAKNPETVEEALKYYNTNLKTAALTLPNKTIMFIVMILVILFGYNMLAKSVHDVQQKVKSVEITQESEIQNIMGK